MNQEDSAEEASFIMNQEQKESAEEPSFIMNQ